MNGDGESARESNPSAMRRFEYEFVGKLEELDFGRMVYNVVWLPEVIEKQLPFSQYPRLRIDAEIGGVLTNCAFQIGGKRRYLILSSSFMKQAGIALSQETRVRFSIADQAAVDVPFELEAALCLHPVAKGKWDALSAGKKRGYVYRVASAKKEETVAKRVEEVIEDLLATM